MNRATYKGFIQFGLINIGIKGYTAISSKDISFKQISKCCNHKVNMKRICSNCKNEVEYSDLLKGYELNKENIVIFDKAEIEQFYKSRSNIEIIGFVNRSDVDNILIGDKKYYLDSDLGSEKPFNLFKEGLRVSGLVAIGKAVLSNKEIVILLECYKRCLLLTPLLYINEINPAIESRTAEVKAEELKLMNEIMNKLIISDFDISKYSVNKFEEEILNLVRKKANGEEIIITPIKEEQKVKDMVNCLIEMNKGIKK